MGKELLSRFSYLEVREKSLTLLSSFLTKRLMFFLWVMIRSKETTIEKTANTLFWLCSTRLRMIGKLMPAIIDDKETIRLIKKTNKNTSKDSEQATGSIQKTTPSIVATPLPPLKPAKTGKIWPIRAAMPNANCRLIKPALPIS